MIKFIYFDVGGVVITDLMAQDGWGRMKTEMGVKPEFEKEFDGFYDKYETEVCLGRDVDTLIPIMERKFGMNFPEGYSLLTDFVNRFRENKSLWPVILAARKKYRIGLLTNIYPRMLTEIKNSGLMPEVNWDVVIDSSQEHLVKPDPEIFKIAEVKAGVSGEEIFYIDNSPVHIETAAKLGWATFLYDAKNPEKASEDLSTKLEKL